MTENKTGVRRPVSPKKQMAERWARESLAAVAQGWGAGAPQKTQAACEGVCNVTEGLSESPVLVRIPEEEKPAKGETLSAAARRRIWERSRYESMRMLPDAMAFHEEALARAMQQGEFEKLAKANGLSEEEVRRVWDVHQDHHRIRVAAQAAGRTAEVPEVEDADFDELQTGEVSAQTFHNTFVCVNAAAVFVSCQYLFDRAAPPRWTKNIILSLGESSLGIYLLHVFFMFKIGTLENCFWLYHLCHVNGMVSTLLYCLAVLLMGYGATQILRKIPGLKFLVRG